MDSVWYNVEAKSNTMYKAKLYLKISNFLRSFYECKNLAYVEIILLFDYDFSQVLVITLAPEHLMKL